MYNANYMEGVPVKIAEKYKPPPQIYKLPQSLVNKLNLADNFYENAPQFQYDMQLERKALSKITEWKRIRQRNKNERRERKERRELQRKKDDEQRQRNLLCSVSYPSADELSSTESEEGDVDSGVKQMSKESTAASESISPQICVTETSNSFHNILQPTVLSNYSRPTAVNSSNHNSVLGMFNSSTVKTSPLSAFNYKDFEGDTSSPFDNLELKTINDLDVLAQVLHNTQLKTTSTETVTEEQSCDDANPKETPLENANENLENNIQATAVSTNSTHEIIPKHNNLPKFTYDLGNLNNAQEAQHKLCSYTAGQVFTNANFSPSLSPETYMGQHPHPFQFQHGIVNAKSDYHNNLHIMQMNRNNHALETIEEAGAKSKSVPDILKELREEIRNSELRRTRNCSQNLENGIQTKGGILHFVH